MDAEIPYFLRQNGDVPTRTLGDFGNIFSLDAVPEQVNVVPGGMWASLSETVGETTDKAFDAVSGTFKGIGDSLGNSFSGVLSEARGIFGDVTATIVLFLVGAVVIVVVLSKTGVLKDITGIVGALK